MNGEFDDQNVEGLSEKIMDVVKSYSSTYSEVEMLKQILIQSNLLLATSNVKALFTHNMDYASEPIRNEETDVVKEGMQKFADSARVIRLVDYTQVDDAHFEALINVTLSKDKVYQISTVYDRTIEEGESDDTLPSTSVHYILKAGNYGQELKTIVDFEFSRASPFPPGYEDECGSCCGSCCASEEEEEECCKKQDKCCKKEHKCCGGHDDDCCCKNGTCCKEGNCCSGDMEEEGEEFDDDVAEDIKNLEFDMDVMDAFTKDCEVGISSEDFLAYLVSMEFYESDWDIGDRLCEFIEEIRNPDPNAVNIDV